MKVAAFLPAPGPGADAEALIKEARRRQRRRQLITALAGLAVLAGSLGALAGLTGSSPRHRAPQGPARPQKLTGHPSEQPGPIPGTVGTTVLMWPANAGRTPWGIYVDKPGAASLRLPGTPSVDPGEYQPILPDGRWIVYVDPDAGANGDPAVVAMADDLPGQPRLLGQAVYFYPSASPGRTWLGNAASAGSRSVTVWPVSIATAKAGQPVTLPAGTQLIAGTDDGLLLSSPHGIQLWVPGAEPRALPRSSGAEVFAVSPRLVGYDTGCAGKATSPGLAEGNWDYPACRTLRIFNVVTGISRSFAAPPGTGGWVPARGSQGASTTAVSPSGNAIVAEAVVPPDSQGMGRTYVVPLTGRKLPVAVPSSAAFLLARTAWSASGSWLFYQGPGWHLWAYQLSTGAVRSSGTPCCQYAMMAGIGNDRAKTGT